MTGKTPAGTLYCGFCGKSQHEVRKLIAGPTALICNECVRLCADIIGEEHIPDECLREAYLDDLFNHRRLLLQDLIVGTEFEGVWKE